jgi:hypothetical protein
MNYLDGNVIRIGDKVAIDKSSQGVVVAIISDGEFSERFPKEEWNYLEKGILIESIELGLIHYLDINQEIELMSDN